MKTAEDYKKEYHARVLQHEETHERFVKNFPKLFKDIDQGNIDVPRGWDTVVFQLCEKLSEYPIQVVQIKQKFATLRVYLSRDTKFNVDEETNAHIHALIRAAEEEVDGICEECGDTADIKKTQYGFIQNLCPKCTHEKS